MVGLEYKSKIKILENLSKLIDKSKKFTVSLCSIFNFREPNACTNVSKIAKLLNTKKISSIYNWFKKINNWFYSEN